MRRSIKRKTYKMTAREHGIITMFVTLIMVPVVVISGILVDAARVKFYRSQAIMAADSYGDAVLSEYDNLLKELYGLFSVTQSEDGLAALDTFGEYAGYSFDPSGGGKGVSGFMPYKSADVKLSYTPVDHASLSNNNVLATQIGDFMKYRVVGQIVDNFDVMKAFEDLKTVESDSKVASTYSDILEDSSEALEKIVDYYEALKKLSLYPNYLDGRRDDFGAYSDALFAIIKSEEYEKYYQYIQNKSAIDAAVAKYKRILNNPKSKEEWTEDDQTLYDQFVDADEYKKFLDSKLTIVAKNANDHSRRGGTINFDNAKSIIEDLEKAYNKLKDTLTDLNTQINTLRGQLGTCNQDMAEKIREEIKELEKIADMERDFKETYELVKPNISYNSSNAGTMKEQVKNLDAIRKKIEDGKIQPEKSDRAVAGSRVNVEWMTATSLDHRFSWNDFTDTKSNFYSQLKDLCESDGSGGNKKKGDEEIEKANKAKADAEKVLNEDDSPAGLRSISAALAKELATNYDPGDSVPSVTSYFKQGVSFGAIGSVLESAVDKFLVSMYDFGMFSSRVTNIQPATDVEKNGKNENYKDYSLTKYEMSLSINYLYGAELEYIYAGHTGSSANLGEVRNVICGIRFALNFVSSYRITEVNDAINLIADLAAEAVAATVFGAPAAPLVRAAVSAALRLAFATIETASDWKTLAYDRGVVTLLKGEVSELETEAIEQLESLLRCDLGGKDNKDKVGLTYENYLFLLIFIFRSNDTILSRTANLITLNRNQAANSGDTLSSLQFKMANTVTAVKTTCAVKMDFVVLPKNFAKMFLSETDEGRVSEIEDTYFGYSIIRGY